MLKSKFSYKKNEKKKIFNFNNNKTTIKIHFVDSYLYVKNNLINILQKKFNNNNSRKP